MRQAEARLMIAIWRELNFVTKGAGMVRLAVAAIGAEEMLEAAERDPVLIKMVKEYLADGAATELERRARLGWDFRVWIQGHLEIYAWQRRKDLQ